MPDPKQPTSWLGDVAPAGPQEPAAQTVVHRHQHAAKAPKTHADLVAEYEIPDEDSDFDPELHAPAVRQGTEAAEPAAAEGGAAPPVKIEGPDQPASGAVPPKRGRLLERMAREVGFTDEEMDATPTDQLEKVVERLYAHRQEYRRQDGLQREFDKPQQRTPVVGGQEEPAGTATPPAADDLDIGISEDDYDPALVGAIRKVASHFRAEVKALRDQLGQISQREAHRENLTRAEQIDAGFADLGDEFHPVIGKGSRAEVDGPELERRRAVLDSLSRNPPKVATLRQAVAVRTRELFGRAAPGAHQAAPSPAAPPAADQKGPRLRHPETGRFLSDDEAEELAKQEAWVRGGLSRPTHRAGAEELPRGPKRAQWFIREFQLANGVGGTGAAPEEDDLPE